MRFSTLGAACCTLSTLALAAPVGTGTATEDLTPHHVDNGDYKPERSRATMEARSPRRGPDGQLIVPPADGFFPGPVVAPNTPVEPILAVPEPAMLPTPHGESMIHVARGEEEMEHHPTRIGHPPRHPPRGQNIEMKHKSKHEGKKGRPGKKKNDDDDEDKRGHHARSVKGRVKEMIRNGRHGGDHDENKTEKKVEKKKGGHRARGLNHMMKYTPRETNDEEKTKKALKKSGKKGRNDDQKDKGKHGHHATVKVGKKKGSEEIEKRDVEAAEGGDVVVEGHVVEEDGPDEKRAVKDDGGEDDEDSDTEDFDDEDEADHVERRAIQTHDPYDTGHKVFDWKHRPVLSKYRKSLGPDGRVLGPGKAFDVDAFTSMESVLSGAKVSSLGSANSKRAVAMIPTPVVTVTVSTFPSATKRPVDDTPSRPDVEPFNSVTATGSGFSSASPSSRNLVPHTLDAAPTRPVIRLPPHESFRSRKGNHAPSISHHDQPAPVSKADNAVSTKVTWVEDVVPKNVISPREEADVAKNRVPKHDPIDPDDPEHQNGEVGVIHDIGPRGESGVDKNRVPKHDPVDPDDPEHQNGEVGVIHDVGPREESDTSRNKADSHNPVDQADPRNQLDKGHENTLFEDIGRRGEADTNKNRVPKHDPVDPEDPDHQHLRNKYAKHRTAHSEGPAAALPLAGHRHAPLPMHRVPKLDDAKPTLSARDVNNAEGKKPKSTPAADPATTIELVPVEPTPHIEVHTEWSTSRPTSLSHPSQRPHRRPHRRPKLFTATPTAARPIETSLTERDGISPHVTDTRPNDEDFFDSPEDDDGDGNPEDDDHNNNLLARDESLHRPFHGEGDNHPEMRHIPRNPGRGGGGGGGGGGRSGFQNGKGE